MLNVNYFRCFTLITAPPLIANWNANTLEKGGTELSYNTVWRQTTFEYQSIVTKHSEPVLTCKNSIGRSEIFPFVICKRSNFPVIAPSAKALASNWLMLWVSIVSVVSLPSTYQKISKIILLFAILYSEKGEAGYHHIPWMPLERT